MCLMNLSIAAVINALTDAKDAEYGEIKEESIDSLIHIWAEYDPKATGFVSTEDLVCILTELQPPLGCNFEWYDNENKLLKQSFEPIVIPDFLFALWMLSWMDSIEEKWKKLASMFKIPP